MWPILIPFLQPLFSQLLSRYCQQPSSGQRHDPQVELAAHLVSPGARQFKPESLKSARPTMLRAIRMGNRHFGRRHENYIALPRGRAAINATLDNETTGYWLSVLDAPADHALAGFKAGCKATLPDE